MKTKAPTLKDFTTENLMTQPVIQKKMQQYNNRLTAIHKAYQLVGDFYNRNKVSYYDSQERPVFTNDVRKLVVEIEKDLNDAMSILGEDNGTEGKPSGVSGPATRDTK